MLIGSIWEVTRDNIFAYRDGSKFIALKKGTVITILLMARQRKNSLTCLVLFDNQKKWIQFISEDFNGGRCLKRIKEDKIC